MHRESLQRAVRTIIFPTNSSLKRQKLYLVASPRVLSIMPNRPVGDQWEFPSKMERHFPIKPGQPISMALAITAFPGSFPWLGGGEGKVFSRPAPQARKRPWERDWLLPLFVSLPNSLPCIRLARGKFELTNQDSAGGKNSSVLKSS